MSHSNNGGGIAPPPGVVQTVADTEMQAADAVERLAGKRKPICDWPVEQHEVDHCHDFAEVNRRELHLGSLSECMFPAHRSIPGGGRKAIAGFRSILG
jgi:hypothetical protein